MLLARGTKVIPFSPKTHAGNKGMLKFVNHHDFFVTASMQSSIIFFRKDSIYNRQKTGTKKVDTVFIEVGIMPY